MTKTTIGRICGKGKFWVWSGGEQMYSDIGDDDDDDDDDDELV